MTTRTQTGAVLTRTTQTRMSRYQLELERIQQEHDGLLRPADVVEEASDPQSPLHDYFEWEDTVAAKEWRLHQAANLIRVTVSVIEHEEQFFRVRTFTSLPQDRHASGGYRLTIDVLTDEQLRAQLVMQAIVEMRTFQAKYQRLLELSHVFEAMRAVIERLDTTAQTGSDEASAQDTSA